MKKDRFLFASVDAPPKTGGVSLLACEVSSTLARHYGNEAVFLGPNGTHFPGRSVPFKIYEDLQSDTLLREGKGAHLEDERIAHLFGKIIDAYSLDQIILWHPFYYGMGALAAGKLHHLPVSIFVHGTELTSQMRETGELQLDNPYSLSCRLSKTLNGATQLLTNSRYSAEVIRKAVPNAKVRVVGCGINADTLQAAIDRTPEYDLLTKSFKRSLIGIPDKPTLAMVGRLVPHKRQRDAIDLVAAMPDTQLIIIGGGAAYETLSQYIDDRQIRDRVFLKGEVSDTEKWRLLEASDMGFLISEHDDQTGGYEGFGIVMLEYTAAGCLPVTNGKFGMADFSIAHSAGFITLNDDRPIEEHGQELAQMLKDQAMMAEALEHARAVVMNHFTWDHVASRVSETLKALGE